MATQELEAKHQDQLEKLQESITSLQSDHRKELDELKIRHKNESEREFEDRISSLRSKYENQISQLKEALNEKNQEIISLSERTAQSSENGTSDRQAIRHWLETSIRSEYDQSMDKLKKDHQDEIEELSKRHSQEMQRASVDTPRQVEDVRAEIESQLASKYDQKVQDLIKEHNDLVHVLKSKQLDDGKKLVEAQEEIAKLRKSTVSLESRDSSRSIDLVR
jgi:hypothetical protein